MELICKGRNDLDNNVNDLALTEISPVLVLNITPSIPTMSPKSAIFQISNCSSPTWSFLT